MGMNSILLRLVFSSSIHLEVASDSFCFLINCPWLLVFALSYFSLSLLGFNLYCWKGLHFAWNNFLIFLLLFLGLIFTFHFWFRDLLRELDKKYEVLLIIFFLVFLLFIVSEGLLFVSFFWTSFHSLSSPTLDFQIEYSRRKDEETKDMMVTAGSPLDYNSQTFLTVHLHEP